MGTPAAHAAGPSVQWAPGPSLPSGFVTRWSFSAAALPPDRVVLFGGAPKETAEGWFNDTWIFTDGAGWAQGPAAPAGLFPRGGAAMAYDPAIGKIVLFGGSGPQWPPFDDTWLFDGTSWTQGPDPPKGLAPRAGARMAYDPDIGKMVLFGGSGTRPLQDTWLFNGSQWTQGPDAPQGMSPRVFFGMEYEPTLHKVVVAGGNSRTDTWYFDGANWAQGPRFSAIGPIERISMAYDPNLQGEVVFGGIARASASSHIGFLSGGAWARIRSGGAPVWPGPRLDAAVVWNAGHGPNGALMVISGAKDSGTGNDEYRDTWFLTPGTATASGSIASSDPVPYDAGAPWPGADAPIVPSFRPAGAATGQITAHDGQFWLGSTPIVLRGAFVPMSIFDGGFPQIASWGANVVRFQFKWTEVEKVAPTFDQASGKWVHTWDQSYIDEVVHKISVATSNGLYVALGMYDDNRVYFRWPDWLYTAPYNSCGVPSGGGCNYPRTKAGFLKARADFWSDDLRPEFMREMEAHVAASLKGIDGIVGYDVFNEPPWGTLPDTHATTQKILGVSLSLARAVRSGDPNKVVFFMTRGSHGVGLPDADLSGFASIGNVAFELHDYFGARWGTGLNEDPNSPSYHEKQERLYNATTLHAQLPSKVPAYIGTEYAHESLILDIENTLAPYGIPVMVGELGDWNSDPGVYEFFGTATQAVNRLGVSWTADYIAGDGIAKDSQTGELWPWGSIVVQALGP
jgi:hypothetical protein